MRTFHYEHGNEAYSTLTVGEMKKILDGHDNDTVLIATWEGIRTPVREPILVDGFHCGDEAESCKALIIDVDQY